ncbi:hypothetical protein HAX54_003922, partial [Datura stramonium]|nr:hypothetical protein [Datura stramonium]
MGSSLGCFPIVVRSIVRCPRPKSHGTTSLIKVMIRIESRCREFFLVKGGGSSRKYDSFYGTMSRGMFPLGDFQNVIDGETDEMMSHWDYDCHGTRKVRKGWREAKGGYRSRGIKEDFIN